MKRSCVAVVAAALAALALIGTAPIAEAYEDVVGITWYTDGTYQRAGPSGTVVVVYVVGARRSQPYRLIMSPWDGDYTCGDPRGDRDIYPGVRSSNAYGLIYATAGMVTDPPGEYAICFRTDAAMSATNPITFTIV